MIGSMWSAFSIYDYLCNNNCCLDSCKISNPALTNDINDINFLIGEFHLSNKTYYMAIGQFFITVAFIPLL